MDNRSFNSRLAAQTESDTKLAGELAQSLCALMAECLADNNDIALPGFGTFESIKTLEHVTTDKVSGRNMLIPPTIRVEFRPGSRLKKAISRL